MIGPAKSRWLDELIAVSLDDLVPQDHVYRHLETKLDLGFVRSLSSANIGSACEVSSTRTSKDY
jgi:hypothetical protein